MATFNGFKQAFARERLAVTASTITLTPATYMDSAASEDVRRRATGARVSIETAAIRFTEDGSTPSATGGAEVGANGSVNDVIYLDGYGAIAGFKMTRASGTDGVVQVVYYR